MRHAIFAAGMGSLLLLLGACAANQAETRGMAPSRLAAKGLDESKYYAPSEPSATDKPAAPEQAPANSDVQPAAYRAPDGNPDAAVEHVPTAEAGDTTHARPLVPAFPAKMEQDRMRDMRTVYFQFDQADLTPDAKRELQADAAWLKAHPGTRVRVEGHADERGTNEYNLALGSRRANQVRDYLAQLGVPIGALDPVSFGEEMPLKAGHDESAWKWNRRVQFSPAAAPRPTADRAAGGGDPRL